MRLPLLLSLTALACQPAAPKPSPRAVAPAADGAAPAPAAAPSSAELDAGSAIRLEPRPGPVLRAGDVVPSLSFRRPAAEEIVSGDALAKFSIEVDAELARLGPSSGVEVSLDGHRARRLGARPLTLATLVPAELDLTPGEHFLIAAAVDGEGKLIRAGAGKPITATVRFWFERRGSPAAAPGVVCWGPNGTFYGAGAEPAIDVLLLAQSAAPVGVILEGEGTSHRASVDATQPWAILGLESGDYRLRVEAGTGAAQARDDCRFTVNRETERPAP